jgi:hypothetical protein
MSEGGLLIHLPEKIEVGHQLNLRLFFASISESLYAMDILVEVVWVGLETKNIPENYLYGVKLINVDPMDFNKLRDFLRSLAQL